MLAGAWSFLPSFRALHGSSGIYYNGERERRGYQDQQQQRHGLD